MNFTRSFAIFLRQWYLLRRNPSRWVFILFWALTDLIIWGLLTVYLVGVGGAKFSFITVLIGAIFFEHLLFRAQHGVAISSMEDVWTKNFMNIFATPLAVSEYLWGLVFTAVLTTIISTVSMGLFAKILFDYSLVQFGPLLVLYAGTLFLFGVALGLLGVSLIIRFGPSAETYVWVIPTAVAPLSGVFYPIATLPESLQYFAQILPSTYVFEGMRSMVLGGNFDIKLLFLGLALAVLYVIIAYIVLLYNFRSALKKGLFSRFIFDAW